MKSDEEYVPDTLPFSGHPVIAARKAGFVPATKEVQVGSTVIWLNEDDVPHAVRFEDGTESPSIPPGEWAQHKFERAGTYNYDDPLNPDLTGIVIVK